MTDDAPRLLEDLSQRSEALRAVVQDWTGDSGEVISDRVPFRADPDDLEQMAVVIDSLAEDVIETAEGILGGKRDSSDLRALLSWEEDIEADFVDCEAIGDAGEHLRKDIADLFAAIRETVVNLSNSVKGRRNFYVYTHAGADGKVFYVGKGTGKRAWSRNRHPLWQKYVDQIGGQYETHVVRDGLLEHEAEALEQELIDQHEGQLVNWFDASLSPTIEASADGVAIRGPKRDAAYFEALERFHHDRNATFQMVARAKAMEQAEPEAAIAIYREALSRVHEYAKSCPREPGLKGELLAPWTPLGNDLEALDRLTLVLKKLGRAGEIVTAVDAFFAAFPAAEQGGVGQRISARRQRARNEQREKPEAPTKSS